MSFANILREEGNFTPGAKGAKNYYTTGSSIIDLNNKVIQGSDNETIRTYFMLALDEINHTKDPELMMRLIVTIINKREFRKGGEGCRRIYYRLLIELYNSGYTKLVIDMVKFMPDIGYYDDWVNIVKEVNLEAPLTKNTSKSHITYFLHYDPLIREIARCSFSQIDKDTSAMEEGSNSISLIGKWMGRENKSHDKHIFWYMPLYKSSTVCELNPVGLYKQGWVNWLTRYKYLDTRLSIGTTVKLIPGGIHAKYRKSLSALNKHLMTPEVMMCAKQYSEIRFEKVASKFINKSMAALLNEKPKVEPNGCEEITGNRFPELEDRVKCRANFLEYLPKMKASAIEFYEIMKKVLTTKSKTQQVVLKAQWDAKVISVRKEIKEFRTELYTELKKRCADLSIKCPAESNWPDIIPLIDCSGSMHSLADAPGTKTDKPLTCLHLAVSLGMGFADVNEGPFECMSISFSQNPELVNLPRSMSLLDRYRRITQIDALSTNYLSTQRLIVDYAKVHNVPQDELPETYCFSDEGFDNQICHYTPWNTTYQKIRQIYKASGYSEVPMTYFHNLSSNRRGFQQTSNYKSVSMLQGYSSSSFKYAFVGNLPAQVEALRPKKAPPCIKKKEIKLEELKKNTNDDFEAMINRPHFDLIKFLMHISSEGVLKDYKFEKFKEHIKLTEDIALIDVEDTRRGGVEKPPTRTWTESILGSFW